MNVAYVLRRPNASFILEKMIVPQLEEGRHGANVVGMFFFVDNDYLLVRGNPTASGSPPSRERRHAAHGLRPVLLSARHRRQAGRGIPISCFPDLYKASRARRSIR